MLPNDFLKIIAKEFPADFLTTDPAELLEFGKDWTKVYEPKPLAVALPRSVGEIARLVKLCAAHGVAVVPSGGRTGLAGGAVAARGELVISLSRMNHMEKVDAASLTLLVQAGAVTQAVHEHCKPHGLTWPVDFSSKGSSHVGGNISTNAGGINVIRYGLTRQWVLGLQVVTASGEILELNGALEKNNTGFDLRQLFIGTEGTMGIITAATLKLTRLPGETQTFLFAVSDIAAVLRLFRAARMGPFVIQAYEFYTHLCLKRVMKHRGLRAPFATSAGCYVLLEVERPEREERLDQWLSSVFEGGLVLDGTMAQNPREAVDFWVYREAIAESLFATGLPHKNDVSLPVAHLEAFCAALDTFFADHYPGWDVCNFGHIGDGNLHINIMKPDGVAKDEFLAKTHKVDEDLFTMVRAHGGSISAEHGIGLLKKDFLHYSRTPAEMAVLRAVKKALDPNGVFNPGKIFD